MRDVSIKLTLSYYRRNTCTGSLIRRRFEEGAWLRRCRGLKLCRLVRNAFYWSRYIIIRRAAGLGLTGVLRAW